MDSQLVATSMSIVDSPWIMFLLLLYPATWLLIPWVLLKHVVHPTARVAWIMAILFLPFVGAIVTLIFGINHVERHAAWKQKTADHLRKQLPPLPKADLSKVPDHLHAVYDIAHLFTGEPLVGGNLVTVLDRTPDAFKRLEAAMRGAKKSLHVYFYIYRNDRIGTRLRDVMIEKAKEGVEVRFMYDELGSMRLTRKFLRQMRRGGVHAERFLAGVSFRARWSVNLRTHRKIVVIDGHQAFTGGMNVGDEYLGRDPGYGYWRDEFVEIVGPAAARMQWVFADDWYYATGEALTDPAYYEAPAPPGGDFAVQILPDGPDDNFVLIHDVLFTAITSAQQSVTIATGYFVPPDALITALTTAARRGIRVRLLTAGRNTYFHTLFAGRSYYEVLLDAGVEVYEYQRGLYHAKFTVVDGVWSLTGTPNFDLRSLMLNFENAVASFDTRIAEDLERHFDVDLQHSRQIQLDEWRNRSVWSRLGEAGCVLLAPVL